MTGRPLRIVEVFNPYLERGGEEIAADRILRDLQSGGHKTLSFRRSTAEWTGDSAPPKWRQAVLMWNHPRLLRELEVASQEFQADLWILHNVVPVVSLGVYRLAARLGVPTLQWLHNYRPISPGGSLRAGSQALRPDDPWIYWRESRAGSWRNRPLTAWLSLALTAARWRGAFHGVTRWIAVSETMRGVFEQAGWYPHRLRALRHATDLQPPSPNPRDDGYFLYLGRLIPEKGIEFLIDLFRNPRLAKKTLVIGGTGPERARLESSAPPNVRWLGYVSGHEKEHWINGARAIVFPAQWPEPLGIVVYEAYNARKPVLASALGGLTETVRHGQTGLALPPESAEDWLTAIERLDQETAARWGGAGFDWLSHHASTEVWLRGFESIAAEALPHWRP